MRARSGPAVLSLALLAASGCKSEEKAARQEEAPTAPETAAASAPPFTGALTVERLEQAARQVLPHQPWRKAWTAARATAGEPTRVEGDLFGWYLLDGGECHFLEVTRDPQLDEVASTQHGAADPQTASYFAKCSSSPAAAPGAPASPASPAGGASGDAAADAGDGTGGGHGDGTGGGRGDGTGGGRGDGTGGGRGDGTGGGRGAGARGGGAKPVGAAPANSADKAAGGW